MRRGPNSSPQPPSPEEVSRLYKGYIEALAKGEVDGQRTDERAMAALSHEEDDSESGPDVRHYWMDYHFKDPNGEGWFVRVQYAGHALAANIMWSREHARVDQYVDQRGQQLLLYSDTQNVWFSPRPNEYHGIPRSIAGCDVTVFTKRASRGWLDQFLRLEPEEYASHVRRTVAEAQERITSGYSLPPKECLDWTDAEHQFNQAAAEHLPEALQHVFGLLTSQLGIQSFREWAGIVGGGQALSPED